MDERILSGVPASPGVGIGAAWRRADQFQTGERVPSEDHERERDAALAALARAAEELAAVAVTLPAEEAAIVEAGVLMARDPALMRAVEEAILSQGLPAADAVLAAAEQHATAIAAIGDETLAARADDVRSLGRRAARLAGRETGLAGRETEDSPPDAPAILIAEDLGPADVAELAPALAGVALVGGGATAHAAIVARSLGVPMVTGLGGPAGELADGTCLALDGTTGSLVVHPSPERAHAAAVAMSTRLRSEQRSREERDLPAATRDRRRVTVLTNVASVGELHIGLSAGAEGIGLLRTELAFLDAERWPTEREHRDALEPILGALDDRPAVVRVLDFGADKSPPFLSETGQRGLELLLSNREALISQLRAILGCALGRDVRILLPLVDHAEQLTATRELLEHTARTLGIDRTPPLGAMIETPTAAQQAAAIATRADFLSIGTNDLTAAALGADRFGSGAACAHHPRVLRLIDESVSAAHEAGITIEVCGEAASDPLLLPLLVGLGVDELSVGAARVGTVRRWIRRLSHAEASRLGRSALELQTAEQVTAAAGPLAAELQSDSVQPSNGFGERIERRGRIHALGA
jgi:phosphoenolpyruvate-protein kinase (PTS system EI component)